MYKYYLGGVVLSNGASNMHSQFMTKMQVGQVDKGWSKLGRLKFDQDFTS